MKIKRWVKLENHDFFQSFYQDVCFNYHFDWLEIRKEPFIRIALNDFVLFQIHGILMLLTSQQWSDHCGKYNRGISKIRISIIVSGNGLSFTGCPNGFK